MSGRLLSHLLAQGLSVALPDAAAMGAAQRAADWQYRRAPAERASVCGNLRTLLARDVTERDPAVRDVFRHFGWYLAEFFSIHRHPPRAVAVEGLEALARELSRHRGGLLVSAHLGNWELGAVFVHRAGLSIDVVALPHQDPRVNRLFDRQRQRCGVGVIPLNAHAARHCLRALRQGRWIGLVGDREFGAGGVAVTFFGHRVMMPSGPAALSVRSGCPIIPVFLIRTGRWRFSFRTEPPMWADGGSETGIADLTQRYVESIERAIRAVPSQWLMMRPAFDPDTADRVGAAHRALETHR